MAVVSRPQGSQAKKRTYDEQKRAERKKPPTFEPCVTKHICMIHMYVYIYILYCMYSLKNLTTDLDQHAKYFLIPSHTTQ